MKKKLAMLAFAAATSLGFANAASAQEMYVGEVRLVAFNFCPTGWLAAQGQTLPITTYQVLFALIGTTYGGNGTTNFQLPNLQGRAPTGYSASNPLGASYGAASVTLTQSQLPVTQPRLMGSTTSEGTGNPSNAILGTFAASQKIYANPGSPANVSMAANAIAPFGGSQPVSVQSPSLSMNWCIAYTGIYPSRP